jgi:UDP-GlcNAc:undecaprenyl-phosphate GlcNAc-1-phosphate transferase
MYSLIFLMIAGCTLSLLLTPLVRNGARRFGLVDQPDHDRKVHTTPIPRLGGVAIFAAFIVAYCLLLVVGPSAGIFVWSGLPLAIRLLPAALVIFTVGLIDDIRGVLPWQKLGGQVVAALLAWAAGIHVHGIGGHAFSTFAGFVITLVWIVACTNAVNLIDGVDGLAAGVGLFATVTTLIAALLNNNISLALATAPLAGALLGFLRFNFNPASIFLGDCGSLTIGFLLGCYGCVWSEKSTTFLSMTAPLLALSVPLFDACLSIVRRFLRQRPIFGADRAHIHHKLLSRGFTTRRVVLVFYGISGIAAAASLLLTVSQGRYRGFVIILVCLAAWLGFQHLDYDEFGVAGKMVLGGAFRGLLNAQLALLTFEHDLTAAATLEQCWDVLSRSYPKFGFTAMAFHLDDMVLLSPCPRGEPGWQVRIDFPGRGYINLTRESATTVRSAAAVPFVDCIARAFRNKLEEIQLEPRRFSMSANDD